MIPLSRPFFRYSLSSIVNSNKLHRDPLQENEQDLGNEYNIFLPPTSSTSQSKSTFFNKSAQITPEESSKYSNDTFSHIQNNDHTNGQPLVKSITHTIRKHAFQFSCNGCGTPFQIDNPLNRGFIPQIHLEPFVKQRFEPSLDCDSSVVNHDPLLCQRCFSINNYGNLLPLTSEESLETYDIFLKQLGKKDVLIIYLVDILDLSGSSIPQLIEKLGPGHKMIVIFNKTDLLPKGWSMHRLKLWTRSWLKDYNILDATLKSHLISSKDKYDIEKVVHSIHKYRKGRDIYVLGTTNVGKSTFVNSLLHASGGSAHRKLTTSKFPGTTLDLVSFPLYSSSRKKMPGLEYGGMRYRPDVVDSKSPATLFDTPGVFNPHQMFNALPLQLDANVSYSTNQLLTSFLSKKFGGLDENPNSTINEELVEQSYLQNGSEETSDIRINGKSFDSLSSTSKQPALIEKRKNSIQDYRKFAFQVDVDHDQGSLMKSDIAFDYKMYQKEIDMIIPSTQIKPATFRLKHGQSLNFGALGRLDYIGIFDPASPLTFSGLIDALGVESEPTMFPIPQKARLRALSVHLPSGDLRHSFNIHESGLVKNSVGKLSPPVVAPSDSQIYASLLGPNYKDTLNGLNRFSTELALQVDALNSLPLPPIIKLTTFMSPGLYIHKSKTINADNLYLQHAGTTFCPPLTWERTALLPQFQEYDILLFTRGDSFSTDDIIIDGLGWLCATGGTGAPPSEVGGNDMYKPGTALHFKLRVPQPINISLRSPLMPFEAIGPNPKSLKNVKNIQIYQQRKDLGLQTDFSLENEAKVAPQEDISDNDPNL